MPRQKKGGNYEREISKLFSLWWTNGARDDVFWRTAGSGGRATGRTKRGARTHGAYGDILATDPIGASLIDLFTIEIKRGYPHYHIADMLDHSNKGRQKFEEFFDQVYTSWQTSGSFSWMLIVRRDKREPFVYLGSDAMTALLDYGGSEIPENSAPFLTANLLFRVGWHKVGKTWKHAGRKFISLVGMRLNDFFELISPDAIKRTCLKV